MSDRSSTLLEAVVNRVREMSEGRASPSSSGFLPLLKREHEAAQIGITPASSIASKSNHEEGHSDEELSQPLDFSSKKIKSENIAGSPESGLLLGSDGHSDNSSNTSGNSPHVSPAHPSNPQGLTPTIMIPTSNTSTPLPAATLNLLSVLQQQQQQHLSANTPPAPAASYTPLLMANAVGNFSATVLPPPANNLTANLVELSKVSNESKESYQKFRETMLQKIEMSRPKGRRSTSSNPSAEVSNPFSQQLGNGEGTLKDDAYWERRKKNNEAAKRSRDARRNKENEVAVRAQFLEQENIQLKMELAQLRSEILNLRDEVYKSNVPGALESLPTS